MHFVFLTKSSQGELSCAAYLFYNGLMSAKFKINVTSYSQHCQFCFCGPFQEPVPPFSCWHYSHKQTISFGKPQENVF